MSLEISSQMNYNYQVAPPKTSSKQKNLEAKDDKSDKPEIKIKPRSSKIVQGEPSQQLYNLEDITTDVQEKTNLQQREENNPNGQNGQQHQLSEEKKAKAVEEANKKLQGVNKKFEFSIHDSTKQIVVKVKNSETDEIIREIPSEKVLDMVANMYELAGLMVDEKR